MLHFIYITKTGNKNPNEWLNDSTVELKTDTVILMDLGNVSNVKNNMRKLLLMLTLPAVHYLW